MINLPSAPASASSGFAIDPKEMEGLRQSARQNSPEAIKSVAKQFEGMFMNMIMKSMRDATPKDGPLDSEQGKMFTSMLDQQLSQNFAKKGVGLADVLIRQLSNNRGVAIPDAAGAPGSRGAGGAAGLFGPLGAPGMPATPAVAGVPRSPGITGTPGIAATGTAGGVTGLLGRGLAALDSSLSGAPGSGIPALGAAANSAPGIAGAGFQENLQTALESGIPGVLKAVLSGVRSTAAGAAVVAQVERVRTGQPAHIRAFEEKLGAHAEDAARTTGIPAKFMLGQAALESGWGKREILTADGSSSHNVFGIKAGASWKGKVVETATTEYINGVPERRVERFRAYDTYADAFRDYAGLLQKNPRYQTVLANAQDVQGFAQGLQRAGYATDPNYAAKLTRIITHSLSA